MLYMIKIKPNKLVIKIFYGCIEKVMSISYEKSRLYLTVIYKLHPLPFSNRASLPEQWILDQQEYLLP
jgi:hypothetical protein